MYGRVLVPPAVERELAFAAPVVGPFVVADHPEFEVRSPRDIQRVSSLRVSLGAGEAEAISLAIETNADLLLVDDLRGRKAAVSLGLATAGVLSVLVSAKSRGLVDRVGPLLSVLEDRLNFRVSADLRSRVLRDADESE
mgnify:CR=1 FL=1